MKVPRDRSSVLAVAGAGLAAVGASVCCVLPLVFVLLGVSGAWISNLTAFDVWRPWFSAATLLCLLVAFWHLYGPPSRCRSDRECAEPSALRRRRRRLWIATVAIGLLLLFPYYVGWFI